MDIERRIVDAVIAQSNVLVTAMLKATNPQLDDLSQRQTFALYGRSWTEDMTRQDKLHARRVGNKIIYSRNECETLRAVQREIGKIQIQSIRQSKAK